MSVAVLEPVGAAAVLEPVGSVAAVLEQVGAAVKPKLVAEPQIWASPRMLKTTGGNAG
jgi:hypothetical protein